MREIYQNYPEILFVDAMYKLIELRMPLYVLLAEDGNGESHIVAVWLITSEDAANIRAMTEIFQQYNEEWCKTVTIKADKDFTERNIFLQQFPQATLLICLFHVLKTFRREITSERVGITSAERYMVLEIVQRMAYSTNEEMYMKCYKELKETKWTKVIEYFNSNWHEIREQWVNGFKDDSLTYQNRTNNRVESINQKLKSVISKFPGYHSFAQSLWECCLFYRLNVITELSVSFRKFLLNRCHWIPLSISTWIFLHHMHCLSWCIELNLQTK